MSKVIALILTYNRKKLLQEAIDALLKQTACCNILIVDNASTDGTKEIVKDYKGSHTNIDYINTGSNLGGAGGFSFGIKECVKRGYDYIWLMDDDTIPYPTALERLIEAKDALKDDFGFLSSVVEWTDGHMCKMNMPLVADEWWDYAPAISHNLLAIKKGSFVSFFISSKTVKRVGLPIKEFFIWYDDSEYSRRIVENENIGYLVADSRVLHKMGSNSKVDIVTENGDRLQRYRMAYRNRYYLNKGKGIKVYVKYYIHLISVICNVIKNAPDNKLKRVNMIVRGTLDGIKFTPPIERLD